MTQTTSEVYLVQKGDTLSQIAKNTGVSLPRLIKLNGLKNPNQLEIGQALYLSERAAFSVQALFLDALRHPIENLAYQLVIDGKAHPGKTSKNGLSIEKVSAKADSTVEVLIKDLVGNWQRVGATVSGYGEKLITLVSPYVSFKDKLDPHPKDAPITATPADKKTSAESKKPALPKKPTGQATPNNPAVKKKKKKGKGGESVIEIGIELPEDLLAYMQAYEDKPISDDDWKEIARSLECEVNVLKAIANVESGGNTAFWVVNDKVGKKVHAPKIMFERHYFHRLTCANGPHFNTVKKRYHGISVPGCKSPYDTHPDICWPIGYVSVGKRKKQKKIGDSNANMPDGVIEKTDIRDNQQDYLRLINAYRLKKMEALKSASWGKFQIMGENYAMCGVDSIEEFVMKMCKNEKGQIQLLAGFIRKKAALWKAVKEKNWHLIAHNYNGPDYQKQTPPPFYDEKMKVAYEYYCKTTA
ncbi:N-acetylmuramidase domain-containing protein (plasmid) [Chromobacterium amazonense]|uniref:LysM peptidoglycan-binding domain-containing protein n=1 Tax=Chromobacterium amazonense TaxID=1382803 RepID=UPI00237E2F64|nr:N-acetylmuramidase domain-containing protein [Chromobacterium amazonense]MDE1714958.1 N-acetylmuramidase domain-containing protein [Chromobacterium amazonense]